MPVLCLQKCLLMKVFCVVFSVFATIYALVNLSENKIKGGQQ